jgi:uncharacterized glyoxalase superfamily protein PhnB
MNSQKTEMAAAGERLCSRGGNMASKGRKRGRRSSATAVGPPTSDADSRPLAPVGAVLGVKDIEQASRFYQTLGFQQQFALPGADGQLTLAVLNHGSSTLLLGRLDELHYENEARAKKIRKGPHGLGVTLTLLVPDLETAYRAVREAGLEILLEPVEEFYGDRVFMFLDPDGYEWKISQTVNQVSLEEVARIVAQV